MHLCSCVCMQHVYMYVCMEYAWLSVCLYGCMCYTCVCLGVCVCVQNPDMHNKKLWQPILKPVVIVTISLFEKVVFNAQLVNWGGH